MIERIQLIWGLAHQGTIFKTVVLNPLSIGGELRALAAFDDYAEGRSLSDNEGAICQTLAYWCQQMQVEGLPEGVLSIDYLLNHLTGEDYRTILEGMERLRSKSIAASVHLNDIEAAEKLNTPLKTFIKAGEEA